MLLYIQSKYKNRLSKLLRHTVVRLLSLSLCRVFCALHYPSGVGRGRAKIADWEGGGRGQKCLQPVSACVLDGVGEGCICRNEKSGDWLQVKFGRASHSFHCVKLLKSSLKVQPTEVQWQAIGIFNNIGLQPYKLGVMNAWHPGLISRSPTFSCTWLERGFADRLRLG